MFGGVYSGVLLGCGKEVLEILVVRGGVGEGALKDVGCLGCKACVASGTEHRVDHERGVLGQLVSLLVYFGESVGEGFFGGVDGGGAVGVAGFECQGVLFLWLAQGVAEDFSTFTGEFSVLKAFKVGVWRYVETLGGCMVR